MDMTITKKERDLLIGLAGVLIAVAVWFLVASPTMEKTDSLKVENASLQPKVEEYQAVAARQSEYEEGIASLSVEKEDILSHYPSVIETEDLLMFWANIDKMNPDELAAGDIEISEFEPVEIAAADEGETGVTYDEEGNVVSDDGTTEATDDSTGTEDGYMLYKAPVAYAFACTYEGAREALNYIYSQYDKNQLTYFELDYDDQSGLLTGSANVNLFYLTGTDKAYEPAYIPSMPTGVENVFHTLDITVPESKNMDASAVEEAEASEEDSEED